jgi:hypothetical protein
LETIAAGIGLATVAREISCRSQVDEAQPADVIVVLGAAEYCGCGVPAEAILVESEGESTVHSIAAVAEIMRRMNLRSCIVVSDGYHIYRVKKLLENQGMKVFGSPRPEDRVPLDQASWKQEWLCVRQTVAYGLWRVGIPI